MTNPKLRKIQLRDFGGFVGTAEIDVTERLVLVCGPNFSGKTSLLDAVRAAVGGRCGAMAETREDKPRVALGFEGPAGIVATGAMATPSPSTRTALYQSWFTRAETARRRDWFVAVHTAPPTADDLAALCGDDRAWDGVLVVDRPEQEPSGE